MLVRFLSIFIGIIFSTSILAQNTSTYIPQQAFQYFTIIENELDVYLPNFYLDKRHYFPALIEHESCISLKHSRCWNPKSRLKTQREEGAGLGQTTRAYNTDGSIRFDVLTDLKNRHSNALKELSWDNIYQRPDLQIRAMILLSKSNYDRLYKKDIDSLEHIALVDAAYNGGLGGVLKEQRVCGLAKNCDPNIWFNNVEKYCLKSKKPLYGSRSACTINRFHTSDVIKTRMPKYDKYF